MVVETDSIPAGSVDSLTVVTDTMPRFCTLNEGDTLRVAMLLPLSQEAKGDARYVDFYQGFLYGLERRGVGIEPAKNKQGNTYGIRFGYKGHTFKASEIGREFGYHSLAGNFSSSPEPGRSPQVQHSHDTGHANTPSAADNHFSLSEGAASLFGSLFSPSLPPAEDDNAPLLKKKLKKKKRYGQQQS